ncbi:MAG: hypothetical protein SGPRY_007091, partial [Prymnesium sp.]
GVAELVQQPTLAGQASASSFMPSMASPTVFMELLHRFLGSPCRGGTAHSTSSNRSVARLC